MMSLIIGMTNSAKKQAEAKRRASTKRIDEPSSPWEKAAPSAQEELKRRLQENARKLTELANQTVKDAKAAAAANDPDARRRQQEELKRRLQENADRRAAERARTFAASGASNERRPLEKQELRRDMSRSDKPVVVHEDADCGGGSIHDGYHEGVSVFNKKDTPRPIAVAGNLGRRLADEDERIDKEAAAVENARRVMAKIAKLPPLAQGMVYSEILGKPKSEAV